ncbi:DUF4180 domain-containing protein [Bacillota bacterium Meth-B3]
MELKEVAPGVALVRGEGLAIAGVQDALDLIATANWQLNAQRIAIAKEQIDGRFFVLSSGLAGEVLQKFVNYGAKLAIYGDFSGYTSKPLRDFIYESNNGRDVFFAGTEAQAVERLTQL